MGCLLFFFGIELQELFIYFGDLALVGHFICKYFIPFCGLPFAYGFLCCARPVKLIRSTLFCKIFITLGGGSQKILLQFISKNVLHMCSSKNFIVSSLIFRSLIHFAFIFLYGVRECFSFILYMQLSSFPITTYWRDSFLHYIFLSSLLQIHWPYMCALISGLSVLFHWSLFLLFVPVPNCFDWCDFVI